MKSHRSHDIVLLCIDCHMAAHTAAEHVKRGLAVRFNIPLYPTRAPLVAQSGGVRAGVTSAASPTALDPGATSLDDTDENKALTASSTSGGNLQAQIGSSAERERRNDATVGAGNGASGANAEGGARVPSPLAARKAALVLEKEAHLPAHRRRHLSHTVLGCVHSLHRRAASSVPAVGAVPIVARIKCVCCPDVV